MADPAKRRMVWVEHAERHIYQATAAILVLGAIALIGVAVAETVKAMFRADYLTGLLTLLDRALLVLMVTEIVHTVRTHAEHGGLEAQPFFIVAIIAAIRRILVITAESTRHFNIDDPTFQAALAELALLAVAIVALAFAMRMIPKFGNGVASSARSGLAPNHPAEGR
jgi:uncharacterized membrane protein (DUF373 family)